MSQQQQNQELQQRTEEALLEAYPNISVDSFRLLCWWCGMNPQEVVDEKKAA